MKYIGEYKDGIPNGQGTLTSPDGDKYVGEFKDGEYSGHGTMTLTDGRYYPPVSLFSSCPSLCICLTVMSSCLPACQSVPSIKDIPNTT